MSERKAPRLAVFGEYDWYEAEESRDAQRAWLELMRRPRECFLGSCAIRQKTDGYGLCSGRG
jgi:hypothetical protein